MTRPLSFFLLWAPAVVAAVAGCATTSTRRPVGSIAPPPAAATAPLAASAHRTARPLAPQTRATLAAPAPVPAGPRSRSTGAADPRSLVHGMTNPNASNDASVRRVAFVGDRQIAAAACPGGRRGSVAGGHHVCSPSMPPRGIAPPPAAYNRYGIDPQEFLCDGGDHPPEARLLRDESIAGLEPEDTVVHYTTQSGDVEFAASNRACVYAPRFASVRKMTGAVSGDHAVGAVGVEAPLGPNRVALSEPNLVLEETTELGRSESVRQVDAMRERNRGVPVEGVLQPVQAEDVLAALATLSRLEIGTLREEQKAILRRATLAAATWSINESVEVEIRDLKVPVLTGDRSVEGFTVYELPEEGRLRIAKFADRHHAKPGDIVNFILRVENVGDSPVTRVTVADNLTTRLEYVEASQESTVDAEFSTQANDAASLRLEWVLTEPLEVGDSATIRFRTRVR